MRVPTDDDARTKAGVGEAIGPGRLCCDHVTAAAEAQCLDAEREAKIDVLRLQFLCTPNPEVRRVIWRDLKAEIAGRSPAQVRRMEAARGLRRDSEVQ